MRARALTSPLARAPRRRRSLAGGDDSLNGPGATMLSIAIFGRREAPLWRAFVWMRGRLAELALGLLLALLLPALILTLRLLLATQGSPPLREWLHGWLAHIH